MTPSIGFFPVLSHSCEMNPAAVGPSAQRASSLTRQLLTFSRKEVLQRRPVDLNAVILEMAREVCRSDRLEAACQLRCAHAPW